MKTYNRLCLWPNSPANQALAAELAKVIGRDINIREFFLSPEQGGAQDFWTLNLANASPPAESEMQSALAFLKTLESVGSGGVVLYTPQSMPEGSEGLPKYFLGIPCPQKAANLVTEIYQWLMELENPTAEADSEKTMESVPAESDFLILPESMGKWQRDKDTPFVYTHTDTAGILRLTEKEVELLAKLALAGEGGISAARLLREVWGYAESAESQTVASHIYRLRQKIESDPSNPEILIGVRMEGGENGYCLQSP